MPYPTDYEDEERHAREFAKRERLIDKADYERDRKREERETSTSVKPNDSTIKWHRFEDELPPDQEHVLATLRIGGYFTVVKRSGPRIYNNGAGVKQEKLKYWARIPMPVEGVNINTENQ